MICYIAGKFEDGNSLNLTVTAVVGKYYFVGNSALLPSEVKDFATLPTQRFWRETVLSLLDVR